MIAGPDALAELLGMAATSDLARADILRRMGGPDRHYHGLDHLRTLWARHRHYAAEAGFDDALAERLVASAIAFHDACYDAGAADNERRSADLWLAAASPALPADQVAWVSDTILATADHLAAPRQPGADALGRLFALRLWVVDLDLTPIGEAPAVFAANTAKLCREQPGLEPDAVAAAQRPFLQRLLDSPRIYNTPVLARDFEVQARRNLAVALGTAGSVEGAGRPGTV